jgi:hypothetical protein
MIVVLSIYIIIKKLSFNKDNWLWNKLQFIELKNIALIRFIKNVSKVYQNC